MTDTFDIIRPRIKSPDDSFHQGFFNRSQTTLNRLDILLNSTDNKENTVKATAISACDVKQNLIDLDTEYEHVKRIERQTTCVVKVHYNIWHFESEMLISKNSIEAEAVRFERR
ncbi:hypothetical protein FYZ48_11095 [Gimesia chilikensis]|uniref:hypothetical protein n=1 Tax=Gimesia chilikensis TaxID=2605989 RepID=UPI0011EDA28C|nr:hypothetical protein [Gimesia chilikensis]KAA0139179.1 hypothetical protein FYZ48_11095 [Gimesia chilikensis]